MKKYILILLLFLSGCSPKENLHFETEYVIQTNPFTLRQDQIQILESKDLTNIYFLDETIYISYTDDFFYLQELSNDSSPIKVEETPINILEYQDYIIIQNQDSYQLYLDNELYKNNVKSLRFYEDDVYILYQEDNWIIESLNTSTINTINDLDNIQINLTNNGYVINDTQSQQINFYDFNQNLIYEYAHDYSYIYYIESTSSGDHFKYMDPYSHQIEYLTYTSIMTTEASYISIDDLCTSLISIQNNLQIVAYYETDGTHIAFVSMDNELLYASPSLGDIKIESILYKDNYYYISGIEYQEDPNTYEAFTSLVFNQDFIQVNEFQIQGLLQELFIDQETYYLAIKKPYDIFDHLDYCLLYNQDLEVLYQSNSYNQIMDCHLIENEIHIETQSAYYVESFDHDLVLSFEESPMIYYEGEFYPLLLDVEDSQYFLIGNTLHQYNKE